MKAVCKVLSTIRIKILNIAPTSKAKYFIVITAIEKWLKNIGPVLVYWRIQKTNDRQTFHSGILSLVLFDIYKSPLLHTLFVNELAAFHLQGSFEVTILSRSTDFLQRFLSKSS